MNITNFDTLNKAALREACRVRGISYSKLDNDGMRAVLKKHEAKNVPPVLVTEAPQSMPVQNADPVTTPAAAEPAASPAPAEKPAPAPKDARNGVTRPGAGTTCARIWDTLDAMIAAGEDTSFEALQKKLPDVNTSTLRTQKQRHRVYSGLAGAAK